MTDTMTVAAEPETPAPDAKAEPRGRKEHLGWALVLICVAQLMVVLDGTIANIALPFIGKDLTIDQGNLTWIVTGYALAFGGMLLLGGRLGDLYGRRKIFMTGLTLFALASLAGGFAQNEAMLLTSRALQGLGAAFASPSALALIQTTFPAGPRRSRAFGVYAMMSGAGAAVGLILGGWLTGLDSAFGITVDGWRLTFLINVPIGLIAAALAPRVLRESESHPGELDVPGAITGTLGLLAVVFGLSRAGQAGYGWGDPQSYGPLAAGVALLALFAFIESRVEHPLLPVRIFKSRTRATSFLVMMIAPAAMMSMMFYLSQFVQDIIGYSSLRAGFAFLPFSFGIVVGATISSKAIAHIAPRYLSGIGTLLAAVSLFMFHRMSVDYSPHAVLTALAHHQPVGADVNYWSQIFPWVVVMAIGMGLTFVPMTLSAVHGVEARDSGIGSGVLNTMQQVGSALGLAALSTVALHYFNSRAAHVAHPLAASMQAAHLNPNQVDPHTGQKLIQMATFQSSFPSGALHAFLVAACMMVGASVVIWFLLSVKPSELAADGGPEAAGTPEPAEPKQRRTRRSERTAAAESASPVASGGVPHRADTRTSGTGMHLQRADIELDPTWSVARRFECGHVQHASTRRHLDEICPVCEPREVHTV